MFLGTGFAQQDSGVCGNLANAFGPWDYRKDRGEPLNLVERAHFTAKVESLIGGISSSLVGQDIDYTLRAFPNHHRALLSAARLADREKTPRPPGMNYTIDCYFDRAIRFKSDDVVARMLYASYLAHHGRVDDARKHLAFVSATAGDEPFTHYNAGLMYLEMKDYGPALVEAHRAMELGFPRTELRDKLVAAGKWKDPDPKPAGSAASDSAVSRVDAAPAPKP